ncbi:MAG: alpha/beta fold hydrolase [Neisseria sp.]|nr:alpha/beta fold hydrolase [Neisseria sp.]
MSNTVPTYQTPSFFGLADKWLATAEHELTHYHEMGSGEAVLFLHGSGTGVSAAANWWLNLPALSQHARCIAIDSIGYGQTQVADGTEYGIRAWVAHAIRVLDALGIEQTWLVGNSLGGWVALQLAIDYPERVLGIVSMGTGGAKQTAALAAHAKPVLTADGIRQTLQQFVVDHDLISDELVEVRFAAALNDSAHARLQEVVAARERDREQFPLDFERLKQLTCPMLLIHGMQDTVIPVSRTWDLLQVLPHADAHLFSQCGHWSQVERADEFNQVVAAFWQQHTGARRE